jgi:acyl dehydratase
MGLTVGDRFETPSRTIRECDLRTLVELGGYTHPLFTDPEYARRSLFGRTPLPGQAVLLLMGGLIEQSGRFDEAVALVGFEDVRFVAPAFDGDEIRVEVEVASRERRIVTMRWRCLDRLGEPLVEATARMLLHA